MNVEWFSHEHARLILKRSVEEAGGQRQWVLKHKVEIQPAYVSLVLNKERPINPRMLKPLGMKMVTMYVPEEATIEIRIKNQPSHQGHK